MVLVAITKMFFFWLLRTKPLKEFDFLSKMNDIIHHLHYLRTSNTISNAQILWKQSVKNFGLTLDCHHALMNERVYIIAQTCCWKLLVDFWQIRQRPHLYLFFVKN